MSDENNPIATQCALIVPGRIPALPTSQEKSHHSSCLGKDSETRARESKRKTTERVATIGEIEFCSWILAERAGVDHRPSDLGKQRTELWPSAISTCAHPRETDVLLGLHR